MTVLSEFALTPQQRRELGKHGAAERQNLALARSQEREHQLAVETDERTARHLAARSSDVDSFDLAKLCTPPSCNTGGTQSPKVTPLAAPRTPKGGSKTIIDTISWTIPTEQSSSFATDETSTLIKMNLPGGLISTKHHPAGLKGLLAKVLTFFPAGCEWDKIEKGANGYSHQHKLVSKSLVLGWVAFGAPHGKHWLYLTGAGLRHRRDHGLADDDLAALCDLDGARLGRIDIALDLYDHGTFSVEQSIHQHATGGYKLERAPANPHSEIFQSDTKSDDYEVARTHYIGKRNASKRIRCYDKGLQLLGTMTSEELDYYRRLGVVRASTVPEGHRLEEWTRVELIYKHDKLRPLSRDTILDRDVFFAGAYPILADLLARGDGIRPSYIPKDEDCEVAKLIAAGKMSYGGLVYFLSEELGWDDARIVAAFKGTKSSARLMVDRERPD